MPLPPRPGIEALAAGAASALALVLGLFLLLIVHRAAAEWLAGRRRDRRARYQPGIDLLLAGREPEAARRLRPRRAGDAAAVEDLLLESTSSVSGPLREAAARVAEETGLVERRLAELASSNAHARAQALESLGRLGSTRALDALHRALVGEGPALSAVAARALGRIRDSRSLPALLAVLDEAPPALASPIAQAVEGFGAAAVPALLQMLPEARRQARIAEILGELRAQEAVPELLRLLSSRHDPELRAACAEALGKSAHPDAAPALMAALADPVAAVRARSAWALGRVGVDSACGALEGLLSDPDWSARVRAAEALSRLGNRGRAVLAERCRHPDPDQRDLALEMLELGDPR